MAVQLLDILGWIDFSGIARLTYYIEATGLTAFGAAWLTASRTLPFITNEEERIKIELLGRFLILFGCNHLSLLVVLCSFASRFRVYSVAPG
ncbi:hypothetical protein [Microbulbifer aggregans]|uniref:hypothetical protein n=1 Tax=Microbulbifer aggregans TaxID=1769779 RepID=UPI001CFC54E8|nr:hypothetical protein [Microbulbifer aggregans]